MNNFSNSRIAPVIFRLRAVSMHTPLIALLLCVLLSIHVVPTQAMTVESVTFADQVDIGETTVPLHNVALLRYLKFFKAYVAALYLPEGVSPQEALDDVPKRLEISYLVAIRGEDFDKGAAPVLKRNLTAAELSRLQDRLDRLNATYQDVRPGDRYALTYLPGRGTELALNGNSLVTIEGADFAAAYFGIWLGQEPIDTELKRALLKGR